MERADRLWTEKRYGIKPGETTMIIEERSPIADNLDHKYRIVVDDELNIRIEQLSVKDINSE